MSIQVSQDKYLVFITFFLMCINKELVIRQVFFFSISCAHMFLLVGNVRHYLLQMYTRDRLCPQLSPQHSLKGHTSNDINEKSFLSM